MPAWRDTVEHARSRCTAATGGPTLRTSPAAASQTGEKTLGQHRFGHARNVNTAECGCRAFPLGVDPRGSDVHAETQRMSDPVLDRHDSRLDRDAVSAFGGIRVRA